MSDVLVRVALDTKKSPWPGARAQGKGKIDLFILRWRRARALY